MAELKYTSYFAGQGQGFKITGGLPIDIRTVVDKEQYLTNSSTWTLSPAYPGLLVSVLETHEVFLFSPDSSIDFDTTKRANWKKISAPDVEITGHMVDIVEYHEQFYNKADGGGDPWEPSEGAQPIIDPNVNEAGKYLCLVVGENDTYINSKDLINLDEYVTKEELNSSLNNIKISYALNSESEYVDTSVLVDETGRIINSSINIVTATLENASNGSTGLALAQDVYNALQNVQDIINWEDDLYDHIIS